MEWTFYDTGGRAVAYCEDGRILYAFHGAALAYLEGDSVYAFNGQHLGWWDHGWVRDHHGAWVLFTENAVGGPPMPAKQARPAKAFKSTPPQVGFKHLKPVPVTGGLGWSSRSGPQFFQSTR